MNRHRTVLITGLSHFAERIAQLVGNQDWRVKLLLRSEAASRLSKQLMQVRMLSVLPLCNVLYQIGGPLVEERIVRACATLRRPIVLHWVGSDVTRVCNDPSLAKQNHAPGITNWVDAEWLKEELGSAGMAAAVVPSCAATVRTLAQTSNNRLTVLTYLPDASWDFYGGPTVMLLAQANPAIDFLIVANDGAARQQAANIYYLGWQNDMIPIFERSHVLLRLAQHDGLSAMVLEALAYGRQVIWNYPIPGGLLAESLEEAQAQLVRLQQQREAELLKTNNIGQTYVASNFSPEIVSRSIQRGFQEILESTLTSRGEPKHNLNVPREIA